MSKRLTACAGCGSTDIARKLVTRSYGRDENDLIVIDDVPVDICRACGESYISAQTLERIEELKKRRDTLTRIPIPVGHLSVT